MKRKFLKNKEDKRMKKTLLALALTAMSGSALASTTIELPVTADVYGKIGASADFLEYKADAEKVDDLNVVRNTEFGVRGSAGSHKSIDFKYDLRIDVQDKDLITTETDYVLDLSRANVTAEHDKFYVTVGLAENSYDSNTRKLDVFSETFTSDFEVFDRVSADEAIEFGVTPSESIKLTVQATGEEISDTTSFGAEFSAKGADFTAAYTKTDIKDGLESDAYKLGAGYDLSALQSPIFADLYVGLVHEERDNKITKVQSSTTSITAGKEFGAVSVALGYATIDHGIKDVVDTDTYRVAVDYAMSDSVTAKAGYALQDKADDDSIFTVGMLYKF